MRYVLHTDGGSRGNPGLAAVGFILQDRQGKYVLEHGEQIGPATSEEAECEAIVRGLRRVHQKLGPNAQSACVLVKCDALRVVRQLIGKAPPRTERMDELIAQAHKLERLFCCVEIRWVSRKQNGVADRLVKAALRQKPGQQA